jgi:hypothetical protein
MYISGVSYVSNGVVLTHRNAVLAEGLIKNAAEFFCR